MRRWAITEDQRDVFEKKGSRIKGGPFKKLPSNKKKIAFFLSYVNNRRVHPIQFLMFRERGQIRLFLIAHSCFLSSEERSGDRETEKVTQMREVKERDGN